MTTHEITPAEYRYYAVDIITNNVLGEIPFTDVTYQRALSKAGSFSGSVPLIAATADFNLYENTMPGKTAIYILRNGVCVWGGIIWSRSYSPQNKILTVDGAEFISYLYHRAVWQTLYYGSESYYCTEYEASAGTATIYTNTAHEFLVGDTVEVYALNSALNGVHTITAIPSLASFSFASNATLSLSRSDIGQARSVVDSYDVARDILGWLNDDFSANEFVNDEVTPATDLEYTITNKVCVSDTATLTTSEVHDLIEGQLVEIVAVDGALNGFRTITAVPTTTSFSFVVTGAGNITSASVTPYTSYDVTSKTISTVTLSISNKQVTDNIATLTTSTTHGLAVGDYVSVSKLDNIVSYNKTATASSGSSTMTVTDASNIVPGMLVSITAKLSANTIVQKVVGTTITLNKPTLAAITSESVTFTVQAVLNGTHIVTAVPTTSSFSYPVDNPDTASAVVTVGEASYKTVTLTTSSVHGLTVGDSIVVENIGSDYDGVSIVTVLPDTRTLRYNKYSVLNYATSAVYGGTISWGARAVAGTYGSYSSNSDIAITSTADLSGKYLGSTQSLFRGSDLRMFGEILEDFAKELDGFEYRIDCDFQNNEFTRSFTFVPFKTPPEKIAVTNKQLTSNIATVTTEIAHNLSQGDEIVVTDVGLSFDGTVVVVSAPTSTTFTFYSYNNDVPSTACEGYIGIVLPLSALGADQNVFEYPGNVFEFTLSENAENSATRMWVGGNADSLDGTASQPYAAATSTSLLKQGWPILDQIEEKNDVNTVAAGKEALYSYAQDFLGESRPPEAIFTISVNGSIDPVVGSYVPGDWCSIIIDDEFVRMRLANDLEPRGDVIVRKIISYSVTVPETPAFPETVTLELIDEWKEDRKNDK
jgi:hypothetical protein